MIIISDLEISNGHGTGVLLKNIIDAVESEDNIVLCKKMMNSPDGSIKHYLFDDYKLHRPSNLGIKLQLSEVLSFIYSRLKKSELAGIPLDKHKVVLIDIFSVEAMWAALKVMRLYPNKKYIVFMMDNFIDFGDTEEGRLNKEVFTIIGNKAVKRFAISKNLALHLEEATGLRYDLFFGPRVVDWNKVDFYHSTKKENKICLIGNAWVEDALPVIDKQLRQYNLKITWFTNPTKFEDLRNRFNLQSFTYGGSFSSSEVIQKASSFKYGLILYGLDKKAEIFNNLKLQEFSIPSKILDYCIGGLEPIYYGPDSSACFDFLSDHNLGVRVNSTSAPDFFSKFDVYANTPVDFKRMKSILQNSSSEHFKSLTANLF